MTLVSVLGDSISTYEGYNPEGYSVYYDKQNQQRNQIRSVYDTWWAKVNQSLHAFLCVNNSYSGSKVSGDSFPAGECEARLRNLRTEKYTPDLILIYLGFNDFGTGIKVRPEKRLFHTAQDSHCFETAYDTMIKTIKSYYPDTRIVCGTLMRTRIKDKDDWLFPEFFAGVGLEEYNDAIRRVVRKHRCYLADISSSEERYETIDGSHPTVRGHYTIAHAWIRALDSLDLSLEPSI